MIIRGMNLPLIIACATIVLALIIFPLIVSYKAEKNGFGVIVAGAGGSAHLAGMVASLTTLPVIGVPIESKKLKGLDSLLSVNQMPQGVVVATVAIDGAFNAGILAASIIGNFDEKVKSNLEKWRRVQTQSIKKKPK